MSRLILRLALLLAPLGLGLAAQPLAAQVFAAIAGEDQQVQALALLATGSESAKQAFEAAAKAEGYKTGRSKNAAGQDEVMMIVPGDGDHDKVWAFYDQVRAGRHGAVTLQMIVLPLDTDTTKEGYLDKARVWGQDHLSKPAEVGIMSRIRGQKRPSFTLGLIATGDEPPMAKFEAAAKSAGYTTARSKGDKGEPDVMLLVRRTDDAAKFWAFYRQSVRGQHGKLAIEVITIPLQYSIDSKDFLDHARVFSSSQIIEP
ncbi:hypothetical protein [Novosphingobium sp.]|uniref:hypothetical protein n=1 Tax=Novosphingobium sp. TaxID=1874826 RepID=UPI0025F8D14B|nr:hypothetical protein [Novosphingobium sp.]MCC6925880.1 hypothetical protein [Novosphingobium sp.]